MLDIPRYFYKNKSAAGKRIIDNLSLSTGENDSEDIFIINNLNDIKLVTDMLEPMQQRGPSENA